MTIETMTTSDTKTLSTLDLIDAIRADEINLETPAGQIAENRLKERGIGRAEIFASPVESDECPF